MRPTAPAASRNSAATRLPERRVRLDSTLPPEILLCGARPSQEVKCWALGISRDDAASFLGPYTQKGLLPADPFVTIDQEGVGELVRLAVERGKKTRPNIKLGICGEHGGDPASIHFCEATGLDYVSCSPYRVPIARLAAAQAALGAKAASQA